MKENLREAARLLANSRRAVALTGAGMSVESGIPDFRSAGGLWTRFPPQEYATISAFRANPGKVWRMLAEVEKVLAAAAPNPGHLALAELEPMGVMAGVVTQNIDGLHRAAGSTRVVEFHGSHATLSCLECGTGYGRGEPKRGDGPPRCACGAILKPDVVFFGEAIPPGAHREALALAEECEVMLIVGTSAEVAPASQLPFVASRRGARIIELNVERTSLTRSVTDLFIQGRAGEELPRLVEGVRQAKGGKGG